MNDPYDAYLGDTPYDDDYDEIPMRKRNRERGSSARRSRRRNERSPEHRKKRERVESSDGTFRCRSCKTVVGLPISGGRHRNHCPLCLYSRHVDRSRPGDRLSDCRSMMQPVGLFTRRNGEQMLVHECLGCGVVRHNRIAADDNTVSTMRLPVLPAPGATAIERRSDESA